MYSRRLGLWPSRGCEYTKRDWIAGLNNGPGIVSGQQWIITMDFNPNGILGVG